jgi:hypothetical protein
LARPKSVKVGQVWFNTELKDYLRITSITKLEVCFKLKKSGNFVYGADIYELSKPSFKTNIINGTFVPYNKAVKVLF